MKAIYENNFCKSNSESYNAPHIFKAFIKDHKEKQENGYTLRSSVHDTAKEKAGKAAPKLSQALNTNKNKELRA